eukprot:4298857-Amphidinium_carterae.1
MSESISWHSPFALVPCTVVMSQQESAMFCTTAFEGSCHHSVEASSCGWTSVLRLVKSAITRMATDVRLTCVKGVRLANQGS